MKKYTVEIILGAVFILLYLLFSGWHSQWGGTLTQEEIDQYMSKIEILPLPEEEIMAITSRLRPWAEADDGEPVYMFNLIHFFDSLRTFSGAPEFKGTPEEANKYYEKSITWLWLSHASYPYFSGHSQYDNLINIQPERKWRTITVARYPNRRTFLKLLADPSYAPFEPYKFIAMELDLVPVSGDMVLPNLKMVFGGSLLVIFLIIGWIRTARRKKIASA
jgi:hypothetical protein